MTRLDLINTIRAVTLLLKAKFDPSKLPEDLRDLPPELLEELKLTGVLYTVPLEIELTRIITTWYKKQCKQTIDNIITSMFEKLMAVPDYMFPYEIDKIMDFEPVKDFIEASAASINLDLGVDSPFAIKIAEQVENICSKAYAQGRAKALGRVRVYSLTDPLDRNMIRFLRKHETYWITQGQGTAEVIPQIAETVRNAFIEGITDKAQITKRLKEGLQEQFINKKEPYWRILASNTVNRARNFGALQSIVETEETEFVIMATLDARTCPVCRELHGRVYSVRTAARAMNLLYHAEKPEEVKSIVPWLKVQDYDKIKGLSNEELQRRSPLPPFHALCRCAIATHHFIRQRITEGKTGLRYDENQNRYTMATPE